MTEQPSVQPTASRLPRPRALARSVGQVLLGPRVLPLVVTAAAGFVLFSLSRAILVLAKLESIETLQGSYIADCFRLGLRFDAIPIGYALLGFAVVLGLLPGRLIATSATRRWVTSLLAGLMVLAVGVEVVGTSYFLHTGIRPSAQATAHFGHFRECAAYIWRFYPVVWFLVALVTSFWLLRRGLSRLAWGRPGDDRLHWGARVALAGVMGGLCVLGCRGGVDHEPLRLGSAYFSTSRMISQLTMNNFGTLFRAARATLDQGRSDQEVFNLPSGRPAAELVGSMLLQKGQVALDPQANPLWRGCDSDRPAGDYNVVVIIMESMTGRYVGLSGQRPSLTPNLDALASDGLVFDRLYAVGPRTNYALAGVLCGYPDMSSSSVLHRPEAVGRFLTLPGVLQQRGYHTMFVYGGNPEFDNMREFFTRGGVDEFIVPPRDAQGRDGNWGQNDELTFAQAHQAFERMGDRKFFAAILTVSNHEPWDIPAGRVPLAKGEPQIAGPMNGVHYADWAIGEFLRQARRSAYFARTIFVLVADHGREFDDQRLLDVPGYRVPCVIYAPGLVKPDVIGATASQTDIAPTILGLLGGHYEHGFMGRDLLVMGSDEGFALIREEDRLAFVRGSTVAVLPPRRELHLFELSGNDMRELPAGQVSPADRQMLRLQMLSCCAAANYLYLTGGYRDPDLARHDLARRTTP